MFTYKIAATEFSAYFGKEVFVDGIFDMMMIPKRFIAILLLAACLLPCYSQAQQAAVTTGGIVKDPNWSKPYPPFRIAGNLYYVGTYETACYLITTRKGHILINAGLKETVPTIIANVEALGFDFSDIKILLTNQVRFDHVGGMAIIKKFTGAKLMIDSVDAPVMADGGKTDYLYGGAVNSFDPAEPTRELHDKDIIRLKRVKIMVLHHPGSTKGSCSYLFKVKAKGRKYKVLIANMPQVPAEMNFTNTSRYPEIIRDFGSTYKAMRQLDFDLWFAANASQFKLHEKRTSQYAYDPDAFADRAGYDKLLDQLQEEFKRKLDMLH